MGTPNRCVRLGIYAMSNEDKKDPIIEALKIQAKVHMTQAAIDKLFPPEKSWDEMTPEEQENIRKEIERKEKNNGKRLLCMV